MTTYKMDNSCSATLMTENDLSWLGVGTMTLRTNFPILFNNYIKEISDSYVLGPFLK